MIEITERCNLDCVMCQRRKVGSQNREMSLETYQRILDKVPSLRQIQLLGYGETLIHRDIAGILELNRSRNLTTTIVTNGFLLTPELVDLLLPGSIINVSIDSPRPETYRAIRGRDLNELADRVRAVHAHRHRDLFWAVNFVVMPDNLTEMADMVTFTRRLGIWALHFPLLVGDSHPYADMPAYRRALAAARRRAFREGRFVTFTSGPGFMPCKCIEPYFLLRLSVTGDIYPCCYIYGGDRDRFEVQLEGESVEVSQREYLMGNILETPDVGALWHGAKYETLRRRLLAGEDGPGGSYDALRAAYRKAPHGFAHCEICPWRNGFHC
ncbi:MAG: radical SAM/SPASM domain-containing protein [Bacteroidota bacterium]